MVQNINLLVSKELFYVLSAAIIIFVLLEFFWPGVVLAYINIGWLLIVWLVDAMLLLVNNRINDEKK